MEQDGSVIADAPDMINFTFEIGEDLQKQLEGLTLDEQANLLKELAAHHQAPLMKAIFSYLAERLLSKDVRVASLPFQIRGNCKKCPSCYPHYPDKIPEGQICYDNIGGSTCWFC